MTVVVRHLFEFQVQNMTKMIAFACVCVGFPHLSHSLQIRTENIDDDLSGHCAARIHGLAVDNRIVDVTTMRTVSTRILCKLKLVQQSSLILSISSNLTRSSCTILSFSLPFNFVLVVNCFVSSFFVDFSIFYFKKLLHSSILYQFFG